MSTVILAAAVSALTAGCATAWCPTGVGDGGPGPFATCSAEHEACGREDPCARGLDCVSTVLCTIGPCPGTCLAACATDDDCASDEWCTTPDGWSADATYCQYASTDGL